MGYDPSRWEEVSPEGSEVDEDEVNEDGRNDDDDSCKKDASVRKRKLDNDDDTEPAAGKNKMAKMDEEKVKEFLFHMKQEFYPLLVEWKRDFLEFNKFQELMEASVRAGFENMLGSKPQ